ncbi:U2 small nuclear ribonucleoprotein A [Zopfia rhizophila CBS 207.26]|uniref:U2 small nuclear ribonucleoprotein A' n=1 Tax=Zopfia rhizophila CBS 207.26 TaxID=1314779 RepID=A0A6A6DQZ7_9PEZI|nr:U2 small nuclear ribonucleoprotein A [Zopfia rhizophila CBS 207.26]
MRLTTELINQSLSYINLLKERELDLRGHKISAIENLGVAKDNDSIDLTDNDIAQLGNFPLNPRIETLLLAQNRITHIQPSLHTAIPRLTTLVLTKNRIAELADLDPLAGFKHLTYLSLIGNPVASKEYYRCWVIWRIPSLRFFDFAKVRDSERRKAEQLFGTQEEPSDLASKIMGIKTKSFTIPTGIQNGDNKIKDRVWTEEERNKMKAMIENAGSLAEIGRLEKMFAEGRLEM